MTRRTDDQRDLHDRRRRENWSLHGWNRIVKVVRYLPPGVHTLQSLGHSPPASRLGGYITIASAINKCTPQDIEFRLGLKDRDLSTGAMIYRFLRLPSPSEYEYELTADHPGGLAHNPAFSDERYPPGSAKIHQWRIKEGSEIPVDIEHAVVLMPGDRFELLR